MLELSNGINQPREAVVEATSKVRIDRLLEAEASSLDKEVAYWVDKKAERPLTWKEVALVEGMLMHEREIAEARRWLDRVTEIKPAEPVEVPPMTSGEITKLFAYFLQSGESGLVEVVADADVALLREAAQRAFWFYEAVAGVLKVRGVVVETGYGR